ncbi:MAG TPA: proline dehydrogenase family protein [Gemmatimonadales bacterium]|nr:proline dehydrogenase family protein [Gemmatimonadales bacterium]
MLRRTFLYLSEQPQIFAFIRGNRLARRLASRFVAGETMDSAAAAVRELNGRGIAASLDLLGESVTKADEARSCAATVAEILARIAADRLDCNVSVKLTQLGLDLDRGLCLENMRRILDRGRELGISVRIDMESSAHTQRTLDLFERDLLPVYGDRVGIVIQSYLRRSAADVDRLIGARARVRLCKGAYQEPATVAFPDKADVDRSYGELIEKLLEHGHQPAVATHDPALITRVRRFVEAKAIAADRFEFQMLYGIRRDLQEELRRAGYRVRVYVPFGTQWYPYLMRRLAERPANIAFILGNVVKETLRT